MTHVRQRDEDTQRTRRFWDGLNRNESSRAIARPVIGLPARPNSALTLRRASEADGKARSVKSLSRSYSASATVTSGNEIRHIPKLSISSEDGISIDVPHVDARHQLHHTQPSTASSRDEPAVRRDKHSKASGAHMHDVVVEVAMEIAEEVSFICAMPRPLDTDEPFPPTGLSADRAQQLEVWLSARFDSYTSATRLMDKYVTAEVLATEIMAQSSSIRTYAELDFLPSTHSVPSPVAGDTARRLDETSPKDGGLLTTPPPRQSSRRKDLSIKLVEDSQNDNFEAMFTPSVNVGASHAHSTSSSVPQGSIQSHRKKSGGLMIGILTVGAILGSPLTTHFDQPGSGNLQTFVSASIGSAIPSYYAHPAQASARYIGARPDNFLLSSPGIPSPRRDTPLLMPRSPLVS